MSLTACTSGTNARPRVFQNDDDVPLINTANDCSQTIPKTPKTGDAGVLIVGGKRQKWIFFLVSLVVLLLVNSIATWIFIVTKADHGIETLDDEDKWIEVDLGRMRDIVGIVTQGSPSAQCWTANYTVRYGNETKSFRNLTYFGTTEVQEFEGNSDQHKKAVNFFPQSISCRYVRIHPTKPEGHACLRLEILHGTACNFAKKHEIYVESGGRFDGKECKIIIDGVEQAKKRRGHCVVIFDPKYENVTARTFSIKGSTKQSDAMFEFIDKASDYSVISIAVMDSAAVPSVNATALLQRLGAVGTGCELNIGENDSWAFVTQKVRSGDPRPPWVRCQHVPAGNGKAVVQAVLHTSAHYDSLEEAGIG